MTLQFIINIILGISVMVCCYICIRLEKSIFNSRLDLYRLEKQVADLADEVVSDQKDHSEWTCH